jgi:hypothetical protein
MVVLDHSWSRNHRSGLGLYGDSLSKKVSKPKETTKVNPNNAMSKDHKRALFAERADAACVIARVESERQLNHRHQ